MSLRRSEIGSLDPGAVPGASTISTSVLAAPEMTYAGECKSNSAYVGGEIGSTGVIKTSGDRKQNDKCK